MPLKPSQLLEESCQRRSYRQFLDEDVDLSIIKDCLLTANTAPSGANKQPWHFVVVKDLKVQTRLRETCEQIEKEFYEKKISDTWRKDLEVLAVNYQKPFLTQAPCLIIIFKQLYTIDESGVQHPTYYPNECSGIATGLLINALRNAGYTSLTYTPAPMLFLREFFNRPQSEMPVMILAVGVADQSYPLPPIKRKSLEEFSTFIIKEKNIDQ
ncbi:MAG: nitroreductase family protein [Erysipelotrichaceae bacterium]